MATTRRKGKPYLYVTWLAKHLSGDAQCPFALWFPSRFNFDKVETDFDLAAWSADHDALVARRAEQLEVAGYKVTKEQSNYFQLKGETAIIAGKMDLVARKPGYAIVLDGKTGSVKKRDWWQVLIYQAILPILWHTDMRISGEVFYKSGQQVRIEPEELTADLRQQIFSLVRRIGTMTDAPMKVPSAPECAFCDIGSNDCPERITDVEAAAVTTSLF